MSQSGGLDCVVIGYNETPFEDYERLIRKYGEDSEAYRDLKFSFAEVSGKKMNYVDILNHVYNLAHQDRGMQSAEEFKSCDIPNLAAVYLAHYLKKRGFEARCINLFQYEKEALARYLAQEPVCVAITTTFYLMNFPVSEMVQFIREHNSKVQIVVGGPLVANHARNYGGEEFAAALEDIGADIYVVESQGELALSQIVACMKTGGDLKTIPNIIYFENGKIKRTLPIPETSSLDENYIDWRLLSRQFDSPTLQTRTARSCAFNCSFCNYPTRAGRLTLAGIETIEKELDSMHEIGIRNVVFIDDTFNVPLPRFKEICRLMIRKKYGFNWFSYFRCSNSDEEAFDIAAESGCKGVFLGIESGSPAILRNMNKAATVEKYFYGIERLRQFGIMTFASFIIGFPGETDETVEETITFLRETRPDYYRAQLWYCEAGTPIEQQRGNFGISGDGFVWQHDTMSSLEAMDQIDRIFLTVEESVWLPQWSFDFWIVPYLLGRGISLSQFKEFMSLSHKLLALEIASVSKNEKAVLQQEYLRGLVKALQRWN
ncbi:MAG: PhpK family radical SAM P-methyltransferase [Blastocatellia bacterium]